MLYNKSQTEYQLFPEEYFSGSDVTVYFADTWVDDIVTFNFNLSEQVQPVYGYNSYTFDGIARGQRIVQGTFTIAFREAGYLYSLLEHIAALQANETDNSIGVPADSETIPAWVAHDSNQIRSLLGSSSEDSVYQKVPDWPDMELPSAGDYVRQLQSHPSIMAQNPKSIKITSNLGYNTKNYIDKGDEVKLLQSRLNTYLYDSGKQFISSRLPVDGVFGQETKAAVIQFQQHFTTITTPNGLVGPQTRPLLNQALTANGIFDAPTKLAVMKFQKAKKLPVTGAVDQKTRDALVQKVTVPGVDLQELNKYEDRIWEAEIGGTSDYRKQNPYFYSGATQGGLQQKGFDIYLTFGPIPDALFRKVSPDKFSFASTVKAIRGVQLTGVQLVISPTGEPIMEQYSFIARDLD